MTSLVSFIAQHSRNTTKQFSQQIYRYREGGFTRLQGLLALFPEERWILLRCSINAVTPSPALASSNDAGNQIASAAQRKLLQNPVVVTAGGDTTCAMNPDRAAVACPAFESEVTAVEVDVIVSDME